MYDAFISYSHAQPDRRIAELLHAGLERYRTPRRLVAAGAAPRLRPIFRDRDDLAVAPDLAAELASALGAARHLIVLCSPRSRASAWVAREVQAFLDLGRAGQIIPVLVEGEPETAFPEPLLAYTRATGIEPLAADVRAPTVRAAARRLGEEKLRILAQILGCRFDDLRQRETERKLRRLRMVVAGLAALAAAAAVAVWLIASSRAEAVRQRAAAERAILALLEETGRDELVERRDPLRAIPYLAEAYARTAAPRRPLRLMLSDALAALDTERLGFDGAIGPITAVAYSPDGTRLAAAGRDGCAVYQADSGALVTRMAPCHAGVARAVRFSPDGKRLATSGQDSTFAVWDASDGRQRFRHRFRGAVLRDVAWHPGGAQLALAGDDGTVGLIEAAEGRLLAVLPGHQAPVSGLAFTPDGSRLVTAAKDGTVLVWDVTAQRKLVELLRHGGAVRAVAVSGDGARILTAAEDGRALVSDAVTGRLVASFDAGLGLEAAALSKDSTFALTGGMGGIVGLWDVRSGHRLVSLDVGRSGVTALDIAPDGGTFAASSYDGRIGIWTAGLPAPVASAVTPKGEVFDVSFVDARHLTTAGPDGVRPWDPARGGLGAPTARLATVAVAGGRLAGITGTGSVRVYDIESQRVLAEVTPHQVETWTAELDASGERLVTTGKDGARRAQDGSYLDAGSARVFAVAGGKQLIALEHAGRVVHAIFSPDGKWIATADTGLDGNVRLWDAASGAPIKTLEAPGGATLGIGKLAFAPNGVRLAAGGEDGTTWIFDVAAGRMVAGLERHTGAVTGLAFTPDSEVVVTCGAEGSLRYWEAASGHLLAVVETRNGGLSELAVSPAGDRVAVAGRDVQLWPIADGALDIPAVRARAARAPWRLAEGRLVRAGTP